jgi:hypothetical protein
MRSAIANAHGRDSLGMVRERSDVWIMAGAGE